MTRDEVKYMHDWAGIIYAKMAEFVQTPDLPPSVIRDAVLAREAFSRILTDLIWLEDHAEPTHRN
jgi:hypothetical protein